MDRQVAARERGLDERADRPTADLAGAEDVEGPDRNDGDAVLLAVGVRHVLAGELRDRVRPAGLADRPDRRDVALGDVVRVRAEDFAGRDLYEALDRGARGQCGLEHVVGADHVDAHRPDRAFADGVDPGDRGEVDDVSCPRRGLANCVGVEHVPLEEPQIRVVGELGARESVPVQVVERDDLVLGDQPTGQRRADEARPAR